MQARVPSSFRDPAGFVFERDNTLYRQIQPAFAAVWERVEASGLPAELRREGKLVEHREVEPALALEPPAYRVLRPERLPFVSYPWEWCVGQLREAALLTVEVQRRALDRGLVFRDASAFNIQFRGARPLLIDSLSLGEWSEGQPWAAYGQFCRHFLAPLALAARVDAVLLDLFAVQLDGLPLPLASRLLPRGSWLSPGLALHLHLHARAVKRRAAPAKPSGNRRMSQRAMVGLVESLTSTIGSLSPPPPTSRWADYEPAVSYSARAAESKRELVTQLLKRAWPGAGECQVWDLGANVGPFSRLAATSGATVVALDADRGAVERHFRSLAATGDTKILPLVQDLTAPTPACGWALAERSSLLARGPADLALALALVHHLAIGNNVPLASLAALLRSLCRRLICEWVPKEDPQVASLLAWREDTFDDYQEASFVAAMAGHFAVVERAPIADSRRSLYLLEGR